MIHMPLPQHQFPFTPQQQQQITIQLSLFKSSLTYLIELVYTNFFTLMAGMCIFSLIFFPIKDGKEEAFVQLFVGGDWHYTRLMQLFATVTLLNGLYIASKRRDTWGAVVLISMFSTCSLSD